MNAPVSSPSRPAPPSKSSSRTAATTLCQRWTDYRPALLQQCLRLLESHADAEDAVSITLLRAMQRYPRASTPILNEQAWLGRILYNVCMDMHRHRKRFSEPTPLDSREAPEHELEKVLQDGAPSPEEVLRAREQSLELQRSIQTLPPRLRIPLVMRFQQGLSYPEIAMELKLTNCNVRKRIQLACEQLRAAHAKQSRP